METTSPHTPHLSRDGLGPRQSPREASDDSDADASDDTQRSSGSPATATRPPPPPLPSASPERPGALHVLFAARAGASQSSRGIVPVMPTRRPVAGVLPLGFGVDLAASGQLPTAPHHSLGPSPPRGSGAAVQRDSGAAYDGFVITDVDRHVGTGADAAAAAVAVAGAGAADAGNLDASWASFTSLGGARSVDATPEPATGREWRREAKRLRTELHSLREAIQRRDEVLAATRAAIEDADVPHQLFERLSPSLTVEDDLHARTMLALSHLSDVHGQSDRVSEDAVQLRLGLHSAQGALLAIKGALDRAPASAGGKVVLGAVSGDGAVSHADAGAGGATDGDAASTTSGSSEDDEVTVPDRVSAVVQELLALRQHVAGLRSEASKQRAIAQAEHTRAETCREELDSAMAANLGRDGDAMALKAERDKLNARLGELSSSQRRKAIKFMETTVARWRIKRLAHGWALWWSVVEAEQQRARGARLVDRLLRRWRRAPQRAAVAHWRAVVAAEAAAQRVAADAAEDKDAAVRRVLGELRQARRDADAEREKGAGDVAQQEARFRELEAQHNRELAAIQGNIRSMTDAQRRRAVKFLNRALHRWLAERVGRAFGRWQRAVGVVQSQAQGARVIGAIVRRWRAARLRHVWTEWHAFVAAAVAADRVKAQMASLHGDELEALRRRQAADQDKHTEALLAKLREVEQDTEQRLDAAATRLRVAEMEKEAAAAERHKELDALQARLLDLDGPRREQAVRFLAASLKRWRQQRLLRAWRLWTRGGEAVVAQRRGVRVITSVVRRWRVARLRNAWLPWRSLVAAVAAAEAAGDAHREELDRLRRARDSERDAAQSSMLRELEEAKAAREAENDRLTMLLHKMRREYEAKDAARSKEMEALQESFGAMDNAQRQRAIRTMNAAVKRWHLQRLGRAWGRWLAGVNLHLSQAQGARVIGAIVRRWRAARLRHVWTEWRALVAAKVTAEALTAAHNEQLEALRRTEAAAREAERAAMLSDMHAAKDEDERDLEAARAQVRKLERDSAAQLKALHDKLGGFSSERREQAVRFLAASLKRWRQQRLSRAWRLWTRGGEAVVAQRRGVRVITSVVRRWRVARLRNAWLPWRSLVAAVAAAEAAGDAHRVAVSELRHAAAAEQERAVSSMLHELEEAKAAELSEAGAALAERDAQLQAARGEMETVKSQIATLGAQVSGARQRERQRATLTLERTARGWARRPLQRGFSKWRSFAAAHATATALGAAHASQLARLEAQLDGLSRRDRERAVAALDRIVQRWRLAHVSRALRAWGLASSVLQARQRVGARVVKVVVRRWALKPLREALVRWRAFALGAAVAAKFGAERDKLTAAHTLHLAAVAELQAENAHFAADLRAAKDSDERTSAEHREAVKALQLAAAQDQAGQASVGERLQAALAQVETLTARVMELEHALERQADVRRGLGRGPGESPIDADVRALGLNGPGRSTGNGGTPGAHVPRTLDDQLDLFVQAAESEVAKLTSGSGANGGGLTTPGRGGSAGAGRGRPHMTPEQAVRDAAEAVLSAARAAATASGSDGEGDDGPSDGDGVRGPPRVKRHASPGGHGTEGSGAASASTGASPGRAATYSELGQRHLAGHAAPHGQGRAPRGSTASDGALSAQADEDLRVAFAAARADAGDIDRVDTGTGTAASHTYELGAADDDGGDAALSPDWTGRDAPSRNHSPADDADAVLGSQAQHGGAAAAPRFGSGPGGRDAYADEHYDEAVDKTMYARRALVRHFISQAGDPPPVTCAVARSRVDGEELPEQQLGKLRLTDREGHFDIVSVNEVLWALFAYFAGHGEHTRATSRMSHARFRRFLSKGLLASRSVPGLRTHHLDTLFREYSVDRARSLVDEDGLPVAPAPAFTRFEEGARHGRGAATSGGGGSNDAGLGYQGFVDLVADVAHRRFTPKRVPGGALPALLQHYMVPLVEREGAELVRRRGRRGEAGPRRAVKEDGHGMHGPAYGDHAVTLLFDVNRPPITQLFDAYADTLPAPDEHVEPSIDDHHKHTRPAHSLILMSLGAAMSFANDFEVVPDVLDRTSLTEAFESVKAPLRVGTPGAELSLREFEEFLCRIALRFVRPREPRPVRVASFLEALERSGGRDKLVHSSRGQAVLRHFQTDLERGEHAQGYSVTLGHTTKTATATTSDGGGAGGGRDGGGGSHSFGFEHSHSYDLPPPSAAPTAATSQRRHSRSPPPAPRAAAPRTGTAAASTGRRSLGHGGAAAGVSPGRARDGYGGRGRARALSSSRGSRARGDHASVGSRDSLDRLSVGRDSRSRSPRPRSNAPAPVADAAGTRSRRVAPDNVARMRRVAGGDVRGSRVAGGGSSYGGTGIARLPRAAVRR